MWCETKVKSWRLLWCHKLCVSLFSFPAAAVAFIFLLFHIKHCFNWRKRFKAFSFLLMLYTTSLEWLLDTRTSLYTQPLPPPSLSLSLHIKAIDSSYLNQRAHFYQEDGKEIWSHWNWWRTICKCKRLLCWFSHVSHVPFLPVPRHCWVLWGHGKWGKDDHRGCTWRHLPKEGTHMTTVVVEHG